jgi:hypothetical protein
MSNTSTPITVLSVSADPGLAHTRELLLLNYGCEVKTSLSKSEAQQLIQSHSFDVLVFGNSLTPDVCQELAKNFRARNPRGKILEILVAQWDAPMNQPDAIAVGPEELIAAIRDFAKHASEPSDQDGLVPGLVRVGLNGGEITCPHCQIPLVMDSVMDSITKVQDCPNCKNSFPIVNDCDSRVREA